VLEVREALPSEYTEVGDLTAGAYLAEGFAGADYAQTLRDVASRAAEAVVLVAVLDGDLVGAVTVATRGGPYAENAEPGDAVMRMLVTDPAARGHGVGTALVQAALDRARQDGCTVMRLSTQEVMKAAHRIYERAGFTRTPERDWRPEPDLLLWTYELPLVYCGFCGEPRSGHRGEPRSGHRGEPGVPHEGHLEPPRYCTRCRRRMVVQVTPSGWTATCVEHGTTEAVT